MLFLFIYEITMDLKTMPNFMGIPVEIEEKEEKLLIIIFKGIKLKKKIEIPGICFTEFNGDSLLGMEMISMHTYLREKFEICNK